MEHQEVEEVPLIPQQADMVEAVEAVEELQVDLEGEADMQEPAHQIMRMGMVEQATELEQEGQEPMGEEAEAVEED